MSRPRHAFERIAFVASSTPEARKACDELEGRYGNVAPAAAGKIGDLGATPEGDRRANEAYARRVHRL